MTVPESHPRYQSLLARNRLVEGVEAGYVAPQGLTAHGRGEAFDYLLGERTTEPARQATEAAAAALLLAERPVLSVNGNVAALSPEGVAELQEVLGARVEVNLFHRTDERIRLITERLEAHGCTEVLGADPDARIPGLDHARAKASRAGIHGADVVLVPLEDGDRCEALVGMGKHVVTIDLNPLSRTARTATTTIVDNLVRALPGLAAAAGELEGLDDGSLRTLVEDFDNRACLVGTLDHIKDRLGRLARDPEQLDGL